MIDRFKEVLGILSYNDLLKLEKELGSRRLNIKSAVRQKIQEIEEAENKHCATCGVTITPDFDDSMSMIFGPRDFKKRAHFCAFDCMQYFLENWRYKLETEQVLNHQ